MSLKRDIHLRPRSR